MFVCARMRAWYISMYLSVYVRYGVWCVCVCLYMFVCEVDAHPCVLALCVTFTRPCYTLGRAISRSSQCSTIGVTKPVVCAILSMGWCIQKNPCC